MKVPPTGLANILDAKGEGKGGIRGEYCLAPDLPQHGELTERFKHTYQPVGQNVWVLPQQVSPDFHLWGFCKKHHIACGSQAILNSAVSKKGKLQADILHEHR